MKYDYIVRVAEAKSISQAAKELYISQPALTKYINNLEDELGVKLFNRKTIPLSLTYAGERFVKEAKRILEIQNALKTEMEDFSHMKKGRLTIGATASRAEYWLPLMIPVFRKKHPGIEIKLIEGSYDELEDMIENEKIDIGLITSLKPKGHMENIVLTEEKIVLAVSEKNHLLDGIDISENCMENLVYISPEKIDGADMISLLPGFGMTRYQREVMRKYDIKPNVVLETSSLEIAYYLACADFGIAFVPETCVAENFRVGIPVLCTIEKEVSSRTSVVIYKKGRQLSQAAKAFVDVARLVLYGDCPAFKHPTKEEFILARKKHNIEGTISDWLDKL